MNLTDYHAKYFAYELTKRCSSDSLEKLAGTLVDAKVDLNPHQVEAALFAFNSPLSKGALLADEVGLGKTIEAGLVISQKWAERKRRILIITPANLRKQWHQEMQEKFFLPCAILETRYNVIANTLKHALKDVPKLLLAATPLQNSLLELFGLVSFIDEYAFGDLKSFREQFTTLTNKHVFDTLKARIKPMCHRTLRRQVTAYVPYTRRHPLVQPFTPEEGEDRLYHLVSEYLRRDNLQALPASQRSLMTLVLRKLLASSTFAIAGALDTLSQRLQARLGKHQPAQSLEEELDQDYEALDETAEEWPEETSEPEPLSEADRAALEQEIADLEAFRTLAVSITHNAKGQVLLVALDRAFAEAEHLGAARSTVRFSDNTTSLQDLIEQRKAAIQRSISERNAKFFEVEVEKLDGWVNDLKVALEREIKDIDRHIKEAKRAATVALMLEEKLAGQKQIKALESQRNGKRRALFDAQDQIDVQRDDLIARLENRLNQRTDTEILFHIQRHIQ